jgi:hypothetical protein
MAVIHREFAGTPHEAPNEGDQSGETPGTFLVIPYFPGDRGRSGSERPLTLDPGVVSWLCPSIVVNGVPGSNTFRRGDPTSVTVAVSNWGLGTTAAPVQVSVWWAEPSTGFTTGGPFGQTVLPVPTGGAVYTSPSIIGTIPTTAPPHVCLLARVSSPFDAPAKGSPFDPVNDRHRAQLNIIDVTAKSGGAFQFMFWAGNPLARAAAFDVVARPVMRETLAGLHRLIRRETRPLDNMALELFVLERGREGRERGEPVTRHQITLNAGARTALHLRGTLPKDVQLGQAVAIEILQMHGSPEGERPCGSIGLIVTARGER